MRKSIIATLCAVLVLTGCTKNSNNDEEPTGEKVVANLEASFEKAKQQFLDAYIVDSGTTMHRGFRALDRYIDPMNDGQIISERQNEVVRGKTLEKWRDETWQAYYELVENNWDIVDEAVREEYEVISSLRNVFNWVDMHEFGQQAIDLHKSYKPMFEQRRANQFYFECRDDERLCSYTFKAFMEKMGYGNVTRSYTGDKDDYAGVVEAKIVTAKSMVYKRNKVEVADLPMDVVIRLDVESKLGSSVYDGSHDFNVSVFAPSSVSSYDALKEVEREHYPKVGEEIAKAIGAWEIPGNIY